MYACICRAIPEAAVRRAGHAGVTAPEDLIVLFGLDDPSCCGRCIRRIDAFAALAAEGAADADEHEPAPVQSAGGLVAAAVRTWAASAANGAPGLAVARRGRV
jgi:bacterioferritin-associated ferredoxin